jgi:heat shock protein HslJ
VAVLVFGATSCGSGRAVESKAVIPRSPGDLVGTRWVLVTIGDSDAVPKSTPFTLDIGDGTASGTGPCNRYHLAFTHDGEDVTTGPVAATKVACEQPLLAAEQRYFADLEKVDTARKEGTEDNLVLSGPNSVRLEYVSADRPASDLTGSWSITNYAASNALRTPVQGTKPSLDFHSNGTLTVNTGCNTGSSTWKTDGTALTIAPVASTLKLCPEPPGLDAQEQAIFAALPKTASVELGRNDAVLLDGNGTSLFVLKQS